MNEHFFEEVFNNKSHEEIIESLPEGAKRLAKAGTKIFGIFEESKLTEREIMELLTEIQVSMLISKSSVEKYLSVTEVVYLTQMTKKEILQVLVDQLGKLMERSKLGTN